MPAISKIVVAVGTYDGVLAGWELTQSKSKFQIAFATPVHEGSVRSITMAQRHDDAVGKKNSSDQKKNLPGPLLSCGYDEVLRTHDFSKRLNSSGEVRTPAEFGTPVCSAFAPPMALESTSEEPPQGSTHCLVGFSEGKLVIYKKRDWSVQHVLAGHEGGISCVAVHPSGKMALTGGQSDGKLKLWDLTKGRLAFVSKINPSQIKEKKAMYDAVHNIVWNVSTEGEQSYAFCYGNHITVRDVASGKELLDIDLPSKVNRVCFLTVPEGLFVAAACNDGSLPVLAVENSATEERRAIMAIEPVDGPVAGEERFKCIQSLVDGHVVTANSAGVVSLMDLRGAIRMIMSDNDATDGEEGDEQGQNESDDEDDDSVEEELAVEIIDAVQLGTGARVTSLVAWCCVSDDDHDSITSDAEEVDEEEAVDEPNENEEVDETQKMSKKRARPGEQKVTIDDDALKKARELVASAKKIQNRKNKKKKQKRDKVSR